MSSTDNRVVKMQFDNAQFKKGAAETQKSLTDLDSAVAKAGKGKGLLDLSSNMEKVAVTASKMQVITTTALATIANKITNVGLAVANSLTLGPLKQGFHEYESLLTKQNTIMNATGKSAKVVKGILNNLNHYSDQTIYSFGNMTDAITKFVNAGVPLKTSVTTIKGIANAAAFAGASSEEASRAMYAFSQSMSLGFVGLQDWMQIENANMGTIRFKNELLNAAVAAGTLTKKGDEFVTKSGKIITATKGWRDGLKQQWATTEVLNTALGKYADKSTALGKKAFAAAQQVRTFSAFMDTLKEAIGSGWSQIFTALFGGLGQATRMWTGLSNAVGGVVQSFFKWTTTSLKTWRHLGGFKKTLEGFGNLLAPIGALLSTIGEAFRAAFPDSGRGSGKALYGLSAAFAAVTSPLQLLADLIRLMLNPMKMFFQIIRIGGAAVGEVIGFIKDFAESAFGLIHLKAPSGNGFLEWLKDVVDAAGAALDKITKMLNKGASIKEAFGSISFPKRLIDQMPSLPDLGSMFGGGGKGAQKASAGLAGLFAPIKGMDGILKNVGGGFKQLGSSAQDAGGDVKSAGEKMGDALHAVFDWLGKVFKGFTFEDLVSSFNIAVLSTFMISVSRFLNAMTGSFKGFAGTGKAVNKVLEDTGSALKSFQTAARAKLILNIAIAIGILAVSLWVLSKIPYDKLAAGFLVIFGLFRMLTSTLNNMTKSLSKMDAKGSSLKIIAIAIAIGILAGAMILLATAMLIYNFVDWKSVIKGTASMIVMMKVMESLANTADKSARKMVAGSVGIALMAGSMVVLAGALMLFNLVKWESMLKAGLVLGAVALAIGLLAMIPYEGIAKVGLAMLTTSAAMLALAGALIIFALVKWESIAKAAVVLGMLTLSLAALMFVGGPVAVSGLVGLAAAMVGIALAALILNKVNWSSIAKAAAVLGLLLVAAALGAAILTVFLYAIAPLTPVIGVLALAIFGLGLALAAFSAAMAIAMSLAAVGTAAFAALGTGAAVAIAVFVQTLASEAPILKNAFLDMIRVFLEGIAEAVPIIVDGMKALWEAIKKEIEGDDKKQGMKDSGKTWVQKLLDGVKEKSKDLFRWAGEMIVKFLEYIRNHPDEILTAGVWVIIKLIEGLATKVGDFVDAAVSLITNFTKAIGKNSGKLASAGIKMVIDLINGMADAIRAHSQGVGNAIENLISAMEDLGVQIALGLAKGILSPRGKSGVTGAIISLISPLPALGASLLGVQSPSRVFMELGKFLSLGLAKGIQDHASAAIVATSSLVGGQIALASEYISKFIQDLDQKTIAARSKAAGLASAAQKAADAASKTKKKKDDKAADKLADRAEKADEKAQKLEEKADKAKAKSQREQEFLDADTFEKAQMRSEDAQDQLDAAKNAEARAAAALVEADALDKQSKAKGVTAKERKKLQAEADRLRAQAKKDAQDANNQLEAAKKSAADALAYQKLAGEEAAAAFQAAFDADAREAADNEAFEKMSDEEKAAFKRKQAEELKKKAQADLDKAKQLAFTDLEAANDLAAQAIEEADRARQYLDDAQRYEQQGIQGTAGTDGGVLGTVVNMSPTDAAAIAMQGFEAQFTKASELAAGSKTIEFKQYNTSPEALSPTEVYRHTNNLFADAVQKIDEAAAA